MFNMKIRKAWPKLLFFKFLEFFIIIKSDNKVEKTFINARFRFDFVLFDKFLNDLLFEEERLMLLVGHNLAKGSKIKLR